MPNPLKNKHIIMAMFVAPILAIIAYFATDYLVAERPHVAKEGGAYPLVASSNCRYQSGQCTLKNADVRLHLQSERLSSSKIKLSLSSELAIEQALVAVAGDAGETPPQAFAPQGEVWQADVSVPKPQTDKLRIAVVIDSVRYFVETDAVFVDFETSFSRDNFSE